FLAFLCYLPYSQHSHVLTVAPQILFRRHEPTGALSPIPNIEQAETFGVGELRNFNWKQLLDSYTCTECGRCTAACPANLTGKLLSPKQVIVDIRHLMEEQEPPPPWKRHAKVAASGNGHEKQITPLMDGVGFDAVGDCGA